jgi:hypothetical protein
MEDFCIWKSNICRYEGINLNVINEFLDILEKEVAVGPSLSFLVGCSSLKMNLTMTATLRFFNSMSQHCRSNVALVIRPDSLSSHACLAFLTGICVVGRYSQPVG